MNQRLTLFSVAALTLFAGCNADPGSRREIALLRAELVDLENEYYALKSRCGDADNERGEIANCDDSGAVISDGDSWPAEGHSSGDAGSWYDPDTPTTPSGQAPATNPSGVEPVPEEIDLSPAAPLPGEPGSSGQSGALRRGQPAQSSPAEILFVGDQTQARDQDGDGKPDGIEAGFVLLDASGQSVTGPARLVFSLMDDALPSGQQRLGLWEHNAATVGAARPASDTQRVFLPWQGSRPEHEELWLFVRLVGSGSSSEASTPVRLGLAGSAASSTARTANTGPEIEINVDGLDQPDGSSPTRRPRWRATR